MVEAGPRRRSSARRAAVSPALAVPTLERIEEDHAAATGALVFGPRDAPLGTVLLETGRICWAVAAGMRRRLSDLLRSQSEVEVERERLEAIYRRCQRESIPLGEALVAEGIVSVEGLQRALRQHTAEALMILGTSGVPAWVAHRRQKYDARFTFAPAEILVSAGAITHPRLASAGRIELEDTLELGGTGAAFARGGGSSGGIPVAELRAGHLCLAELGAVGRWAADTLDVCAAFSPERHLVTTTTPRGQSMAAWSSGSIVFVAICGDPSELAAVVVKRARRRRAERA